MSFIHQALFPASCAQVPDHSSAAGACPPRLKKTLQNAFPAATLLRALRTLVSRRHHLILGSRRHQILALA